MTDTLLERVTPLVEQMQSLARQAHTAYSADVDAVVRGQSRDIRRIERLLDGMLGFCFDPAMLLQFKKLCRHYYAIDPTATASYVYAYRDMWDSENTEGGDPTNHKVYPSHDTRSAKKPKKR